MVRGGVQSLTYVCTRYVLEHQVVEWQPTVALFMANIVALHDFARTIACTIYVPCCCMRSTLYAPLPCTSSIQANPPPPTPLHSNDTYRVTGSYSVTRGSVERQASVRILTRQAESACEL